MAFLMEKIKGAQKLTPTKSRVKLVTYDKQSSLGDYSAKFSPTTVII